jgi:hypothetical protein
MSGTNTRELDRKTDDLLRLAGIVDRLVTRGERPTRRELDALDGVYMEAAAATARRQAPPLRKPIKIELDSD